MKKLLFSVLTLLILGLAWYLFVKRYDYQFETTAKYGPGAVFYELSGWKDFNTTTSSDNIRIRNKQPYRSITQEVRVNNKAVVEFKWELEQQDDSTTALSLNIRSEENRLGNRLGIINPFQKSRFLDSIKQNVLAFKKELRAHQEVYRIKPQENLSDSPETDCICSVSRDIPIARKAEEMMATISGLDNYFVANELEMNGTPFLKVTNWDRDNDIIDFEFCFPVAGLNGLKEEKGLKFRHYDAQSSLKFIFNGNYRLSHLAWFDALFLAEEKGLEVNGGPLEVYHDNPRVDMNSREWKAEVYLPVN